MTDALTLLATRRSVPAVSLTAPGPDETALQTILTLASRVSDHGKLVPWRFIVYRDPHKALIGDKLVEVLLADKPTADAGSIEKERGRFQSAPVVIAVVSTAHANHPKIPEWEMIMAAGAVTQNLILAAYAQGFGAQWLTGPAAYDERLKAFLGIKPDERVAGFIHIGTPTETLPDRPRPVVNDITMHWAPA